MPTDEHKEARKAIATEVLHQFDTGYEAFVFHCHVMEHRFSNLNLNPGHS
jgi:FtsP/CotA-like multicopper oxidase with cupredoxin domain